MAEQLSDWQARRKAVDVRRSCIVQAPAGSGKTELLTQRLLALLAVVEKPEEILAITFTRKAAGEMKLRLLEALTSADMSTPPAEPHARHTWELARQVLEVDQRRGWTLAQNPARLQVMTIDGLCAYLTRRMPWLSRLGGQPAIADRPQDLYRQAAERLLGRMDDPAQETAAQEHLLAHLDNRMTLLRDLLAAMLAKRDQWLRHLLDPRTASSRELLESSLKSFVEAALERTCRCLDRDLRRELVVLGNYAAGNLAESPNTHAFGALASAEDLTADIRDLGKWHALAELTLTANGALRKTVDKRSGFPADRSPAAQEMKARMKECLETLRENPPAVASLQNLRFLPATRYTETQWTVLDSLVKLLPLAAADLQEVFRLRGEVDFIEIAGGAHVALGDAACPEDLLLQMDSMIRHALVDEFQDTSYSQFGLLQKLTAGWIPGDGRTLFIVGDPMQSIYRFREADVGIFLHVWRCGMNDISLERLRLTTNFRSQTGLVEWSNTFFHELFPVQEDEVRGAVPFSPAEAVRDRHPGPAVCWHVFAGRQDIAEARKILEIVRQKRAEQPQAHLAVLVRSRLHLHEVVRVFKEAGLSFQAQDVDCLADRPVIHDLLALTRALIHPADRVSWLAVLRAPWCGLTLPDLHALCGGSAEATFPDGLHSSSAQLEMFEPLSDDGRQRLERCLPILEAAVSRKGRLPLRRLVEGAWLSLGGPACVDSAGLLDAGQFFTLLERLDEGGDLASLETLEERLRALFAAPAPEAGPELQVMTIHKAKGLEFDTVILPGMGRSVGSEERDLLRWLEHPDYELLLAPLPPAAEDAEDPTYRAIGRIMKDRNEFENLRLLYVAATRARDSLHLLGHVRLNSRDEPVPTAGSFFDICWPLVDPIIQAEGLIAPVEVEACRDELLLKRLPLHWSLPKFAEALRSTPEDFGRPSDFGHYQELNTGTRHTEEGRVVGILIHFWLQTIAEEGLEHWSITRLESLYSIIDSQLYRHGLPRSRHEPCRTVILASLENSLRCPLGRWLLTAHVQAACEFELNGLVENRLVRSSIDRTFVEHGIRWIVDYKTSRPEPEETSEDFLQREVARYAGQLRTYARLMRNFDPDHAVRAGLYFPRIHIWREVPDLAFKQEEVNGG